MVSNITVACTFYGIVERITVDGITKLMAHNTKWNVQRWYKNTDGGLRKANLLISE